MINDALISTAAKLIEKVASVETQVPAQLTIKEACAEFKVSRWTIARWLRQKDANGNYLIVWFKIGKAKSSIVRIDRASFMAFFESMTVKAEVSEPQEINNGNKKGGESK